MVGGAGVAEGDAGVSGDDLYRQVLVGDIRAYLFAGAHAGEDGHGGGKGNQPRLGQARGDAEHVLLGDAHVVKAVREGLGEMDDGRCLGKVGGEADDLFVVLAQFGQRAAVDLAGGHGRRIVGVPVGSGHDCHIIPPSGSKPWRGRTTPNRRTRSGRRRCFP